VAISAEELLEDRDRAGRTQRGHGLRWRPADVTPAFERPTAQIYPKARPTSARDWREKSKSALAEVGHRLEIWLGVRRNHEIIR
jgi:hypothetical protein